MKKFELQYTSTVEEDSKVNVCFRPKDDTIVDFISTFITFENEEDANSKIPKCLTEIRSKLFEEFLQMDNVPNELKKQFEL